MASNSRPVKKKTTGQKTTQKKNNNISKQEYLFYNEILIVAGIFCFLLLLLSSFGLFGEVGNVINKITFGLFGITAYIFPFILLIGIFLIVANKGSKLAQKKNVYLLIFLCLLSALIQLFSYDSSLKLSQYFEYNIKNNVVGGFIGGLICKLFHPLMGFWGSLILLITLCIILSILITEKLLITNLFKAGNNAYNKVKDFYRYENDDNYDDDTYSQPVKKEIKRKPAKTYTFSSGEETSTENKTEKSAPSRKKDTPKTSKRKNKMQEINSAQEYIDEYSTQTSPVMPTPTFINNTEIDKKTGEIYEQELHDKFGKKSDDIYTIKSEKETFNEQEYNEPIHVKTKVSTKEVQKNEVKAPELEKEPEVLPTKKVTVDKDIEDNIKADINTNLTSVTGNDYNFPPIDLLRKPKESKKSMAGREHQMIAKKLEETLGSFGVKVTVNDISVGPTVTRYELQPEQGVKVSKITNLADDIKLNLAATDIRIEAPIPGKAAVGIEVPNSENAAVLLRELIESKEFGTSKASLAFAVGKDLAGMPVVTDLAKMPHLLIAGQTGSGKSVCINTLIVSILYKYNPKDVKLIMIDPKVVELSVYNGIPHLLIPVVTDPKKASGALNWAVQEMVERYNKFAELGVRDMKGYNQKVSSVENSEEAGYEIMPQIVIIVDELADLMMVAPGEVEDAICRLAQMARAAGIHLIIATQRPSVNVITGLIKANIPSRIAFSVASAIDSRTILDGGGAEKLLGRGDMLFYPSGYPKPVRLQGAFIDDQEVSSIVEFLSSNNNNDYSDELINKIETSAAASKSVSDTDDKGGNDKDQYFVEAGKFIIEKDKASIGMLQRVYKIGFNRAARIMDQLYDAGVVGPEEGTKPRKVLMSMEQFEQYIEEYL